MDRAETQLTAGELEAAVWTLREGIRRFPGDARLRIELGQVHLERHDGSAAESTFKRAIDLGANEDSLKPALGEALLLQGKYDSVLEILTVRPTDPPLRSAQLHLLRAQALEALGNERDALLSYVEAFRANDERGGDSNTDTLGTKLSALASGDGIGRGAYEHHVCSQTAGDNSAVAAEDRPTGTVFRVGPQREFALPSQVAELVRDGDVVEIDAGVYAGDVAVWRADGLTLRGVGGRAHLRADGAAAERKGIWVIKGDDTVVENIAFSGARVPHKNGAGIRQEGANLTVRNSTFHNNENGILSGAKPESHIIIENSEFNRNGHGDGFSHNIYVGRIGQLTFQNNYSHHAKVGHQLKSRAAKNVITNNILLDGEDGNASYLVDLPEGGLAFILGNTLHKGSAAQNPNMIAYAAERKDPHGDNRLYVVNNTAYNRYLDAVFVNVHAADEVRLINNLIGGAPTALLVGAGTRTANHVGPGHGMRDPGQFDFRLTAESSAIDAGVDPGEVDGVRLLPGFEHSDPTTVKKRQSIWKPDLGAYEFCGL